MKEANIDWEDTTIGKRGIIRSPAQANYVKTYIGRISASCAGEGTTGGSVRVLKATHGLDTILGAVVTVNKVNRTDVGTIVQASVVNASTLLLELDGFTAAGSVLHFDAIIFGTAS